MPPNSRLLLIWAVLLFAQFLFTGVSFVVPPEPSLEPIMAYIFGFPALLTSGGSLAVGTRPVTGNPESTYILRWALAEAATLLGFVSWFITGERLVQFACLGLALLAILAAFPRTEPVR